MTQKKTLIFGTTAIKMKKDIFFTKNQQLHTHIIFIPLLPAKKSLASVTSRMLFSECTFTIFYLFNLFLQVPDSRLPTVLLDEQTESIR